MAKKKSHKKTTARSISRKKKQSKAATLPKLQSLLFCDLAVRDPSSNKVSAYGLFDSFEIQGLDNPVSFSVIARLVDGVGELPFSLEFIQPDGSNLMQNIPEVPVVMNAGTPARVIIKLDGLQFEQVGLHQIRVRCCGRRVGIPMDFQVKVKKRDGSKSKSRKKTVKKKTSKRS